MTTNTITRYGKRYELYYVDAIRKEEFDKLKKDNRGTISFVSVPAETTKTSKRYYVYFRLTSAESRRKKVLESGLPYHIRLKDHRAYKEKYPQYFE